MMYWYVFSSSGPLMKKKFNEYEVATRDCLGEERLVRVWRPYNSEVSSESVRGYEHIS
jgi:hypothetical protein